MKTCIKRNIIIAASLLALPMAAVADWAPKGPITLMIGFAPGGAVDTQARLIGEELEIRKGWKIIPQNVPGKAGGVLAARLSKQPADGTAIGFFITDTVGYGVLAEKHPGYSEKDFTYLTTTTGTQTGVVARSDKGWKTLTDVAAAMKKGQTISFGAMSQRLADGAYLLGKKQGVQYNVVNFKGGKAVRDAIVAGDIDVGWVAGIQDKGVKSGQLVNLASGEATRLEMSPNAPTAKELGVNVDFGIYFILVAPKGLPKDAREALTSAIVEIVRDPKSKANAFITQTFGKPTTLTGIELETYIAEGIASSRAMLSAVEK